MMLQFSLILLEIMTFSIMILEIMTLSIIIHLLEIMTFSLITFLIKRFSRIRLEIMQLIKTYLLCKLIVNVDV